MDASLVDVGAGCDGAASARFSAFLVARQREPAGSLRSGKIKKLVPHVPTGLSADEIGQQPASRLDPPADLIVQVPPVEHTSEHYFVGHEPLRGSRYAS